MVQKRQIIPSMSWCNSTNLYNKNTPFTPTDELIMRSHAHLSDF